jgi:hypothetical protein
VEKVLTLGVNGTGSAVVSARRSVEGYDTRRLHAMALLLLLAGKTVERNQRHTTDAFISPPPAKARTTSCGYRAEARRRPLAVVEENERSSNAYGWRIAARCCQASCKAPAPLGAIGSLTSSRRIVGSSNPKC